MTECSFREPKGVASWKHQSSRRPAACGVNETGETGLLKTLSDRDWIPFPIVLQNERALFRGLLSATVFMILPIMILLNLIEQNHGGQNHEAKDSIRS